jgi:hypothetical protein
MILTLKEGASKKDIKAIEKALANRMRNSGFNAKKYNGVLKLKENPLAIQSELSDD